MPLRQKIGLSASAVFIILASLELILQASGLIILSVQEHRNRISLKQKATYRIMCLGESTTMSGGTTSYPSQLEEILNQNYAKIKFSVIDSV